MSNTAKKLFTTSEVPKLTLICDKPQQSFVPLLLCLINNAISKGFSVIFLHSYTHRYLERINASPNVRLIDMREDMDAVLKFLSSFKPQTGRTLVVLDSLTPFFVHETCDILALVKTLCDNMKSDSGVYVGINDDGITSHYPQLLNQLEYLANCCVRVHNYQRYIDAQIGFEYLPFQSKHQASEGNRLLNITDNSISKLIADVELRKASGKFSVECFVVTFPQFASISVECRLLQDYMAQFKPVLDTTPEAQMPEFESTLPFNLSLTDEQKKSRSVVVLPYMRTTQAEPAKPAAQILYTPDKDDDYDDEDPDDDLDF